MGFVLSIVYLFIYYFDPRTEVTSQAIRSSRTTDNTLYVRTNNGYSRDSLD